VIPEYEIKVVARDQGNPPLSSTATIILRVLDANDNSPEFYPQQYLVTVSETLQVGEASPTAFILIIIKSSIFYFISIKKKCHIDSSQ
jgi:hypothetical protein